MDQEFREHLFVGNFDHPDVVMRRCCIRCGESEGTAFNCLPVRQETLVSKEQEATQ